MKYNLKNNNLRRSAKGKQAGLSLIELLISSLIGVFLIAGVITNFVGTKDSERVRAAMSEMDANARVAMDILRQTVSHAGYSATFNGPTKQTFFNKNSDPLEDTQCRDDGNETVFKDHKINGIKDKKTDDGLSTGDQMTVVYYADNPCKLGGPSECQAGGANEAKLNDKKGKLVYYDCVSGGMDKKANSVSCSTDPINGMYDGSKAKIYSAFYLNKKYSKKLGTATNLACFGSRAGQAQDLVENVENMQIRYGVTDAAGTRYMNATDVTAAGLWHTVSKVQIALLMRSSIKNVIQKGVNNYNKTDTLSSDSNTFTYKLLDQDITIKNKDRRLYRVYSTTVLLANSSVEARAIRQ